MFEWVKISPADRVLCARYLGVDDGRKWLDMPQPDHSFFPPNPYQFRWYVAPKRWDNSQPAVFLHIMTGDDPTDKLHDHDWRNTTHVLAGQLREFWRDPTQSAVVYEDVWVPGDVIHRTSLIQHRLELCRSFYAITLFTIGQKVRDNKTWEYTK